MLYSLPDNILPLYVCAHKEFDTLLRKGYLQVQNNKFVFIDHNEFKKAMQEVINAGAETSVAYDFETHLFPVIKHSDAFICKLCALLIHKSPMPWDAVINAFDLYNPENCRFSGRTDTILSKKLLEIYKISTSCE